MRTKDKLGATVAVLTVPWFFSTCLFGLLTEGNDHLQTLASISIILCLGTALSNAVVWSIYSIWKSYD